MEDLGKIIRDVNSILKLFPKFGKFLRNDKARGSAMFGKFLP